VHTQDTYEHPKLKLNLPTTKCPKLSFPSLCKGANKNTLQEKNKVVYELEDFIFQANGIDGFVFLIILSELTYQC
jgi:hypothetical protein